MFAGIAMTTKLLALANQAVFFGKQIQEDSEFKAVFMIVI